MGYHQLMRFHQLLGFPRHFDECFNHWEISKPLGSASLGFGGCKPGRSHRCNLGTAGGSTLRVFRTSPLPLFSEKIVPYLGEIFKGSMVVLISSSVQLIERKGTILWWTKELLQEVAVCKVNILWNSSATLLYSCWIPFLILQARWHIFGRNIFRATLWQSNITMDDFRWKKTKCSNRPWSIAMLVFE